MHGSVEKPTTKKRRPAVAVVLNLVGPGSGYLYVGRPKRALVAAGTDVVFQIVMWNGFGGLLAEPWAILIPYGLALLLNIVFLVDAARIAVRGGDYQLRWYNRGWIYIGVIVAIIALETLDQFPATGINTSVGFFSVASGGMAPTLRVGERAIVDMRAFDAREPQRGDLVVFTLPGDPSTLWVRRVIGLPTDRIQMIAAHLHINGEPVKRERIEADVKIDESGQTARVNGWRETLPNGVTYATRYLVTGSSDNTPVYDVPSGHYFMMGDDRDNAIDSRELSRVGYVPRVNIIGRVSWIFWSHDLSRVGARAG